MRQIISARFGCLVARSGWIIYTVALGALLGCQGSNFAFAGNWEARRKVNAPPGVSEGALSTASRVDLDLKPDGTFELIDAGMPKSGTWQQDGAGAVLNVQKIMDKPISALPEDTQKQNVPVKLTPKPDGTLLLLDPAGFDPDGLILKRLPKQP